MKKAALLLGICIILTALFAACGNEPAEDAISPEVPVSSSETVETEAEASPADIIGGLPNPMVEVDENGIFNKLGLKLNVPEGAENVKYFVIGDELGEIQFTLNGVEFCARIKPDTEFNDISGMFYDFETIEDATVSGLAARSMRHKSENETVDVALWYDVVPGIMYSLSAQASDLDGFDIIAIAEQVYAPMQGEVG